jgi:hypothetical protein
MADREAKLSLNSQIVSVSDERTHLDDTVLYVCTDDPNKDNCFIVQENNPMKFFQTIYQETRQIYLRHGKWYNYLLHFSIWQDASFSILHLKRGKTSLNGIKYGLRREELGLKYGVLMLPCRLLSVLHSFLLPFN